MSGAREGGFFFREYRTGSMPSVFGRHKDTFNFFQSNGVSLPDFPSYDIVAYRLQECLILDWTVRSVHTATSILENLYSLKM